MPKIRILVAGAAFAFGLAGARANLFAKSRRARVDIERSNLPQARLADPSSPPHRGSK